MNYGKTSVRIVTDNITTLAVDAIVNAANSSLLGGGGVDGAIHRAAGPDLVHECRILGGCKTGQAKITKGYNLPAKHIIHTVGPVWRGGDNGEPEQLESCYQQSLEIGKVNGIKTIAFSAISTGIFSYPAKEAAAVAIHTIFGYLDADPDNFTDILLVCFEERIERAFKLSLNEYGQGLAN